MHSQLSSAVKGTKVFLWLGVNNLDSSSTVNLYASLAKKYTSLKFYAISVTGVSSKCTNVNNNTIKTFNTNMKAKIAALGLSNLMYKTILSSENPVSVLDVKSKDVFAITNDSTDSYGIHYTTSLYKFILRSMLNAVGSTSSSGGTVNPNPGTESTTYTVVAGDSLWAIANRYGTTVDALRAANGISGDLILVGQVLIIP